MENYKDKLQESKRSQLNEGAWNTFRSWIEFGQSKHPVYGRFIEDLNRAWDNCRKAHPPLKDVNIDVGAVFGDNEGRFTYTDYEENPKYIACTYKEKVRILKELIAWMKKAGPKKVCQRNRNKKRCEKWFEKEMFDNIREFKEAEAIIKQMGRTKISKAVFAKLQSKIG